MSHHVSAVADVADNAAIPTAKTQVTARARRAVALLGASRSADTNRSPSLRIVNGRVFPCGGQSELEGNQTRQAAESHTAVGLVLFGERFDQLGGRKSVLQHQGEQNANILHLELKLRS